MKVTVHYNETETKVIETDYVPMVGDRVVILTTNRKRDFSDRVEQRSFIIKGKVMEAHVFLER